MYTGLLALSPEVVLEPSSARPYAQMHHMCGPIRCAQGHRNEDVRFLQRLLTLSFLCDATGRLWKLPWGLSSTVQLSRHQSSTSSLLPCSQWSAHAAHPYLYMRQFKMQVHRHLMAVMIEGCTCGCKRVLNHLRHHVWKAEIMSKLLTLRKALVYAV
jgi:hypothetical protein